MARLGAESCLASRVTSFSKNRQLNSRNEEKELWLYFLCIYFTFRQCLLEC
jgi:hypothetical protein